MNMFRSLKYRNFQLFFYGQSISLLGTWMQKTAVSWLVYKLTGSALLLGLVTFASLIPSLVLSPFAGSYIEKHDRFKILVKSQIISMMQAGTLAVLIYFKIYSISALVFLSLLQGIINSFDVICRQTLMMDMVGKKEDLPNAIALNSTMTNLARIIGPALAGLVLGSLGEDFCFIGNFVSYIPVLFCLYRMDIKITENTEQENYVWTELKEGFDYLVHEKDLISLIVLLAVSSLIVIPFNTLMPIFAKDIFHGTAGTFSLFESAIGLGAVMSAVYMANLQKYDHIIKIIIVSGFMLGSSVMLLAGSELIPVTVVLLIVSGIGMMAQTSAINTYIQTHAHPSMRSRSISYYIMAYQGLIPVGSLLAGVVAETIGVRLTVVLQGLIGLIAVLAFYLYWKRMKTNSMIKENVFIKH
ncbi:MFS transporter [Flavobacterium cerinum]|uniref:MFS transporter n=1 Tax=Flavobacterium cerinum TaxID=2502784 RepID=A0ABY5IP98_9FLAO|nr:MFS transporter [Flavobacterium cerinum]UUC44060.1 MFS transporter [Flavobacterium cerinum]